MIAQFPLPYPDELLYSRLCRYHIRSGNPCLSHTSLELYGTYPIYQSFERMTGMTDDALRWICKHKSLRDVILTETMFPVYSRFCSRERRERELYWLLSGVPLPSQERRVPRYCPACAAEDRERYGETYWHRVHQIRGVAVCPEHGCRLVVCDEGINVGTTFRFYDAETLAREECSPVGEKTEIRLARYAAAVMNAPFPDAGLSPVKYLQERLTGGADGFEPWLKKNVVRLYGDYAAHFEGAEIVDIGSFVKLLRGTRVDFMFFCQMGDFLKITPPE